MAKTPDSLTGPTARPDIKPAVEPAAAGPIRWFRVTSPTIEITRAGAAPYTLRQGHVLNSADHDIVHIRQMGVKLQEENPPGWWVAEQHAAIARADALRARGLPVPEPVRDVGSLLSQVPAAAS